LPGMRASQMRAQPWFGPGGRVPYAWAAVAVPASLALGACAVAFRPWGAPWRGAGVAVGGLVDATVPGETALGLWHVDAASAAEGQGRRFMAEADFEVSTCHAKVPRVDLEYQTRRGGRGCARSDGCGRPEWGERFDLNEAEHGTCVSVPVVVPRRWSLEARPPAHICTDRHLGNGRNLTVCGVPCKAIEVRFHVSQTRWTRCATADPEGTAPEASRCPDSEEGVPGVFFRTQDYDMYGECPVEPAAAGSVGLAEGTWVAEGNVHGACLYECTASGYLAREAGKCFLPIKVKAANGAVKPKKVRDCKCVYDRACDFAPNRGNPEYGCHGRVQELSGRACAVRPDACPAELGSINAQFDMFELNLPNEFRANPF